MAPTNSSNIISGKEEEEEENSHGYSDQLLSLPQESRWEADHYCQFQGFWFPKIRLEALKSFQQHFQAQNSDMILATLPKSGTTWFKSLIFSIVNRTQYSFPQHPLLTNAPHVLVPFLDFMVYQPNRLPDLSKFESPRLFGTHVPYASLAESIRDTGCKIVYLCRNPRDTFISLWKYMNKKPNSTQLPIEEAFALFCRGVSLYGPFWEHVLGYWRASLQMPEKILFMKYEDMKRDSTSCLMRMAEFLGYPFSPVEVTEGVTEEILKLCSFEHLKNLDVNKNSLSYTNFSRKILFRKAEVGDWVNYFTPPMLDKLDCVIEEKLHDSGLVFQYSID